MFLVGVAPIDFCGELCPAYLKRDANPASDLH
jgi:hypothetical protein